MSTDIDAITEEQSQTVLEVNQHIEEMDTNLIPTYYNNTDFFKEQ